MPTFMLKLVLPPPFLSIIHPETAYEVPKQWCVADRQIPEPVLQAALNWACQKGADCSKIQVNQPWYLPNALVDHASYAFNSYHQKYKHSGASCIFNYAALTTETDPSHGSCHFNFIP